MAVLNEEEFKERLKTRFGETEDEEDLAFLADITDTYEDLKSKDDGYKGKYEDMKRKYRDRFFNSSSETDDKEFEEELPKPRKFEDLFK